MIFGVGSTPPPAAKVYHQPLQTITDRYKPLTPRPEPRGVLPGLGLAARRSERGQRLPFARGCLGGEGRTGHARLEIDDAGGADWRGAARTD